MIGNQKSVAVAMHVQAADGVFAAESRDNKMAGPDFDQLAALDQSIERASSSSRDATREPSSRTNCLNVARACGNRAI